MSKKLAKVVWDKALESVPKDFTFMMSTGQDTFAKGSQVYLCYGRLTNRELLKRYGFCLTNNKYNNICIKLKLEVRGSDFRERISILQELFQLESVEVV